MAKAPFAVCKMLAYSLANETQSVYRFKHKISKMLKKSDENNTKKLLNKSRRGCSNNWADIKVAEIL